MANNSTILATDGKRLEGKVAIITGGASGIGACTAKLFIQHGAKVIIGDLQDDLGLALCREVGTEDVSYVHCDVTSDSDVKNLVDTAISKYGKLDIMYNNAGIIGSIELAILQTDNEVFKKTLEVNLYGGFLGAKHAARVMIPAQKGVILFTASVTALTSGLCSHPYTVSKVAVVGLMKNLCVDLGPHGIRVNSISPPAIGTPLMLNALGLERSQAERLYGATTALRGAVSSEEDVATAALFLASDEAKIISGHNLVLDGGYSTTNLAFNVELEKEMITTYQKMNTK